VKGKWPEGYTPVFEGICSSIRIVVDYGKAEGLVLLALVNNNTGEELNSISTLTFALNAGTIQPRRYDLSWQDASKKSLDTDVENFEGYVLVWRRPGQTPFRLKVKYVDYLRLHRMVSGVSAKAILRGLSDPAYKGELNEWINESNPWFSKFVSKWVRALQGRHNELMEKATHAFKVSQNYLEDFAKKNWDNPADVRKAFALEFQRTERNDIKGILFAMYDGKDASAVAWKLTKPMIKNSQPMIHGKDLL
jgi:RNA ligase